MGNKQMTVADLLEALKNIDPAMPVEIGLKQYNKVFPVAYIPVFTTKERFGYESNMTTVGNKCRIAIHLPENMRTSKLKTS